MKILVNEETGEIINTPVEIKTDKAPAIVIDVSMVAEYHTDPLMLAKKIEDQAGYAVFDVSTKKGRDECRSHAANIIKCISPAAKESQRLAEQAKAVVKQDLTFRKVFEERVREIAEFHRKPLTEWEESEKLAEEACIAAEEKRLADIQYLADWDLANELDELFELRKIRREKEEREFREQCDREEKERIELETQARVKAELEKAKADTLARQGKAIADALAEQQEQANRKAKEEAELKPANIKENKNDDGIYFDFDIKHFRSFIIKETQNYFTCSREDAEQELINEFSK